MGVPGSNDGLPFMDRADGGEQEFRLCTLEEDPEPEDIADAIAALVSAEFRWATGERIEVPAACCCSEPQARC